MSSTKRLIPSLAALSVSLTGCGDDIAGNWALTTIDGSSLPFENFSTLSATGGAYDGFYYGYALEARGSMVVSASGEVSLIYKLGYAFSYEEPGGYSYAESYDCTYTFTGSSLSPERRRFEIRFNTVSTVCVDQDGNREEDGDEESGLLNLDCSLHPEYELLDCIDRNYGGYYSFERGDQ